MMNHKVDFDTLAWECPMPGVRHKVQIMGKQKLRLVEYTAEMEPHWCSVGHFGHIISGRFEITFDHGVEVFEAGDGVTIPDGEGHRHMAKALTETVQALFVEQV